MVCERCGSTRVVPSIFVDPEGRRHVCEKCGRRVHGMNPRDARDWVALFGYDLESERERLEREHPVDALLESARRAGFSDCDEGALDEMRRICDEPAPASSGGASFVWFEEAAAFGTEQWNRMREIMRRAGETRTTPPRLCPCRRCGGESAPDEIMRGDSLCASCRSYELLTSDGERITVALEFDTRGGDRDALRVNSYGPRSKPVRAWRAMIRGGAGDE
jgi:hypothetical protein